MEHLLLHLNPVHFPNTGFELDYFLGPGEIVHITADGFTQLKKPGEKMQICSFLMGLLWLSSFLL